MTVELEHIGYLLSGYEELAYVEVLVGKDRDIQEVISYLLDNYLDNIIVEPVRLDIVNLYKVNNKEFSNFSVDASITEVIGLSDESLSSPLYLTRATTKVLKIEDNIPDRVINLVNITKTKVEPKYKSFISDFILKVFTIGGKDYLLVDTDLYPIDDKNKEVIDRLLKK